MQIRPGIDTAWILSEFSNARILSGFSNAWIRFGFNNAWIRSVFSKSRSDSERNALIRIRTLWVGTNPNHLTASLAKLHL